MFSGNGNSYIIPLGKNLSICKEAVKSLQMTSRFMYQKGKKGTVVEYKDEIIDGHRILTYRDLNESTVEQTNYLRHMEQCDKNYTEKNFFKLKDFMGVTVLQTSLKDKKAQEIYELYKKRWTIETYYNYFKNKADYNTLNQQDYYKTQGLAFIMLTCALIHREFQAATSKIKGKSIQDCLLEARMVKVNKHNGSWIVCNCKKKQMDLFKQLNTSMSVDN